MIHSLNEFTAFAQFFFSPALIHLNCQFSFPMQKMSSKISSASSAAIKSPPNSNAPDATNEIDKTCVVCFKIVDIFSIGECDHPVCYECSTSK